MINPLTRRRFITGLSGSLIVLPGCGKPAARVLDFARVDPPAKAEDTFSIRTTIRASGRGMDDQDGAFGNVAVVGYLQSKRIVCRRELGRLELGYKQQIILNCSERPDFLTFTINSHGCEYHTAISVLQVNDPNSELTYTILEDKRCDDPELPIPDQ